MDFRRAALGLVLLATLAGCGSSGPTAQCDLASTALNQGQLATAAELYARAQRSGEGSCADTGLDSVANRYASAFREAARGTALEVAADNAGAQAAYQSALALDQGNQPAINGLTRLGVPQEQRITSLPLPATPPYPQATAWTGWPIVLPTFLIALAALAFALLRRPAPGGYGSDGSARGSASGRPAGRRSWWGRANDWVAGGRQAAAEGPPEDEGYAADRGEAAGPAEPRLGSPVAAPRPSPEPPTRPVRPVTGEDARTDPITVVTPQGLDLGRRSDQPRSRTVRPHDPPAEDDDPDPGASVPGDAAPPPLDASAGPARSDGDAAAQAAPPGHPTPATPGALGVGAAGASVIGLAAARAESESADPPAPSSAEPPTTEPEQPEPAEPEQPGPERPEPTAEPPAPQPSPTTPEQPAPTAEQPPPTPRPDPALVAQGAEIGQLQRLLDRSFRADDRPLPRRYFAAAEPVPGPVVGVTLAVCVVGLSGSERLLCVQRLVDASPPDADWVPDPDRHPEVAAAVARRAVGSIRDHDERIWATDPVADERALLRLVDAARPVWTDLLRGAEPPDGGPLNPSTSPGSAILQGAVTGRGPVADEGPSPTDVRVVALVGALLVEGAVTNARVEAQHREMPAVAAAESIESALAAELADLQ
ncbi:hypothetical protein [Pseudonocardia sp. WMMC193]|uniref:hypothetical protein n=1 Tax=Pseudonocardia sp. WMMC193 TaxID=2911965 RepID=UPI001F1BB04F|nr:hypothetical protein [Pseudonocardia sp. WMMC193]MCF7553859.1 hypothetical protein [Pseudonocardia sp. WMMC193]